MNNPFFLQADVLKFDNTHSWTRARELFYTIRVLPPDTELCEREEELQDKDEFVECTEDLPQAEEVVVKAVNSMGLEPPSPPDGSSSNGTDN